MDGGIRTTAVAGGAKVRAQIGPRLLVVGLVLEHAESGANCAFAHENKAESLSRDAM